MKRRFGFTIRQVVCLLLVVLSLSSCGKSCDVSCFLKVADQFVAVLTLLDNASQLYQSHVTGAIDLTLPPLKAKQENPQDELDLPKIARDWEANWNKVDKQTAELEKKFKEVESASKKYFTALDQVTKSIKDTKQRAEEAQKNRDARQKWDKAYADAKKQIDRARSLRDKGNDLKQVILLAAMRGKIAEATATLDSISREAQSLLVSLEALTAQGRSIVPPKAQ
jgi:septal ring factor EnvC (AmiA/AmiB activator)